MTAPADTPSGAAGRTSCRMSQAGLILSLHVVQTFLVRLEREDGLPRIVVRDRADRRGAQIAFDEEAYSLGLDGAYEFDTDTMRFTYSSMTTPAHVFDYDMRDARADSAQGAGNPFRPRPVALCDTAASRDRGGRRTVPISLLHRKDTPLDGSAPCLLYGYGAYGHCHPGGLSRHAPFSRRPRLCLCHRACARRQGQGLRLVRGRQAAKQGEYLYRFHRCRGTSDQAKATRDTAAWWRKAARRAACSWARSPIAQPIFSPGSSPSCLSSTC